MTDSDGTGKFPPLMFCITGSIAASTIVPLLQVLVERDRFEAIRVVLSASALRFVRPEPLAVLTRNRCITDLFEEALNGSAAHVALGRQCGLAIVAPATANLMAKLAQGIADDTVTTALSVFEGPTVLVPAAHAITSRRPSFLRNLEQLRADGYMLCGPVEGYSMSENRRTNEVGAMPRPEVIAAYLEYVAQTGSGPEIEFPRPVPIEMGRS